MMKLAVFLDEQRFRLTFGSRVFAPEQEVRSLEAIRGSLLDRNARGPEEVYVIAMDVGLEEHRGLLREAGYLLGVVAYAAGRIGREPVRSQGHVHKPSPHNGWSPPELFEIWKGEAIVYMQESVTDDPGRCYAVRLEAGDSLLCPPAWGHMVINASVSEPMMFGALCDRNYAGFDYDAVRAHGGLAHFPLVDEYGEIRWQTNGRYESGELVQKRPERRWYTEAQEGRGLYAALVDHPELFRFVPHPEEYPQLWRDFVP